jgi:hypothetical protein
MYDRCQQQAASNYAIHARREDLQRQDQAMGQAYAYDQDQRQAAIYRQNRARCEPMAANTVRCGIYQPPAIAAVIDSCAASLANADRVYGMTVCMVEARDCLELRRCMGLPQPAPPAPRIADPFDGE